MTEVQQQKIQELLDAPSLYPEVERKPREQRERELIEWLEKYREVNVCYNLYGMDRADAQPCDDWLDMTKFAYDRWQINRHFRADETGFYYDHTVFTRNKIMYEHLMSYWYGPNSGIYIPSKAVFQNTRFYVRDEHGPQRMVPADFSEFIAQHEGKRLVFKQCYGEKGMQVVIADIQGGKLLYDDVEQTAEEFQAKLATPLRTFVVQDYLVQHPVMARFNPESLNTMRMVTYNTGKNVYFDKAAIRMGRPGSKVDNAYADGLYTNVKLDGTLEDSLFCFTTRERLEHDFHDIVIPYYQEAIELIKEIHTHIPEVFTVGWDVAITEHGPIVVEANDGWALFVTQTAFGYAARPAWNKYFAERRAFEAENGRFYDEF